MGARCIIWTQVTFAIFIPCFFQVTGVFSTLWLVEDGIKKGLFYQTLPGGSIHMEVLDQATLGLQATSAILLLLCAVSCFITTKVYGPDEDGDISNDEDSSCYTFNCLWFYCNIGIYIIASILMLSGCWRIGSQFPMENMGVSFYLCLSSFLLMWLMVVIFICDHICKKRRAEGVFYTLLNKIYEDAI